MTTVQRVAETTGDWRFVVIWEFRVPPGLESRFETEYGAAGMWTELFRKAEGYIASELVRDSKQERTYLTLDFWKSRETYEDFRLRSREAYRLLDARGEALTESEREVGRFEKV